MSTKKLMIAIDETGNFAEAKLQAAKGKSSGVAAALTLHEKTELENYFRELAARYKLSYPKHFHRMEIQNPNLRKKLGLELTQAEADTIVSGIKDALDKRIEALVGVYGAPQGRRYFHEQEAYGDALLSLIEHIHDEHKTLIHRAEEVEIRIATRDQTQLMGYSAEHEYSAKLVELIEFMCRQSGWPARLMVTTAGANHDVFLKLADFFASDAVGAGWSKDLAGVTTPSLRRVASGILRKATPASELLFALADDREPPKNALKNLKAQSRHDAVAQLIEIAHAQVRDRGGAGSMDLSEKVINFLWDAISDDESPHFRGEVCAIAAEICAHKGLSDDSEEVQTWTSRTKTLTASAWGRDAFARRSNRLAHQLQAAQTTFFNVFDFVGAFLTFDEELSDYIALAGGEENLENDETYGKLLGTLGQACGFLRGRDQEQGALAWNYLVRSAPCFRDSQPMFRAMSVGFRLTDLWDRNELEKCESLMRSENLAKAKNADAYSLLHRLRLAAAQKSCGQECASEALVRRLLVLLEDEANAGKTPFDLCLKWALYLDPKNTNLYLMAIRWLGKLDKAQIAILATSLPLAVQVGRDDVVQENLALLKAVADFSEHWQTTRAGALKASIEDGAALNYAALKAMPWNYA
tara:strand:+ start:90219 stop:92135 length:1917 start_codon:yes stop_codon:yes gene_type:complete